MQLQHLETKLTSMVEMQTILANRITELRDSIKAPGFKITSAEPEYIRVAEIPFLHKYFWKGMDEAVNKSVGIRLSYIGKEMDLPFIFPANSSSRAHHVDVIEEFKRRLDADPSYMANYRSYQEFR